MISTIYAVILALLIVMLSFNVIKLRRKNRIKHDDGGIESLSIARAAHTNATEYIPITLLLLFALEYNGGYFWLVNSVGVLLVVGRCIHAYSILSDHLRLRAVGMLLTFFSIITLAIANLFCLLILGFPSLF